MSDQERNFGFSKDEELDVFAHGKNKKKLMASEEAPKDDEPDDDVEAHGSSRSKLK